MLYNFFRLSLFVAILLGATGAVWAQAQDAGDPLPMCGAEENAFYVFQWQGPTTANLRKIALGDYSSPPISTTIWSGKSPATVAAGMGLDGYAYGIAGYASDVSIVKYGSAGAEVLGPVVYGNASLGTLGDEIIDKYDTKAGGNNYNNADIHPQTGHMFAGALYKGQTRNFSGGTAYLDVLLEIDVTTSPPQLVRVLDITPSIPQTTGDFAISADGQYAYAGSYGTPTWWRVDLSDGTLTSSTPLPGAAAGSYGAAAQLPNGDFAFDNHGTVDVFDENGAEVKFGLTYDTPETSQDGARCLVRPDVVVTKSSNPASGTTVAAPSTITYTLSAVVSDAPLTQPLVLTDTLGADLSFDAVANAGNYAADTSSAPVLTFTLPSDTVPGTYAVSYTVSVEADATGSVGNVVIATGGGPNEPACSTCTAEHPITDPGVAGDPLLMCGAEENAYYAFQWQGSTTANLTKVALGDYSSPPTVTPIWSAESPATVAAGMGLDGYAYGIAGYVNDISIIKYGSAGAADLGPVVYGDSALGTVGDKIIDKYDTKAGGNNYNAADIHPQTGQMFAGALYKGQSRNYSGGTPYLDVLLVIDVTTSPPQLVRVLDITPSIPETTGDFAISADGQYAYAGSYGTPTWWRVDLSDGTLTSSTPLPGAAAGSYGAAAQLPNGDFAFDNHGTVDVFDENGAEVKFGLTYAFPGSASQDGARCLVRPDPVIVTTKSSSPVNGTAVAVGDIITYTLSAVVTDAALTADLVLTDTLGSGLTFGTVTSTGNYAADTSSSPVLTFTLPSGTVPGTYAVSYTVTVNADATGSVVNTVVSAGGSPDGPTCLLRLAAPTCATQHSITDPVIVTTKSSNPANGTAVAAGDTITYTLSAVVTDAALTADLVLTDTLGSGLTFGTVTSTGNYAADTSSAPVLTFTLSSGTVPGTYAVSYTVTVNADATGSVVNTVVSAGGSPDGPTCLLRLAAPTCATQHLIADPAVAVSKSSNPANGAIVAAAETITYTLSAVVTDAALTQPLVLTDTLGSGLTFGTVTSSGDYVADPSSAPVLTFTLPSGTVPGTYAVSYTVSVDADATGSAGNIVVATGGGDTPPECSTCETGHQIMELPADAVAIPTLSQWGLILLGLGMGSMVWLRRRRFRVRG